MKMSSPRPLALVLAGLLAAAVPARAQFLDSFDGRSILADPEGLEGWSFFTGDGEAPTDLEEFGKVRVVEVLGGDPAWTSDSVTLESLCRGELLEDVLNSQMIIDWAVEEERGERTHFTISRPVLQRLLDGRTLGLAIQPLGAVVASFRAAPGDDGTGEPRLLFDVED